MSLINDALKRARDVDRKRGASPPTMSLKPVEPAESKPNPHSKWLVLAIVIVALGLSLWSFSRWAISTPPPSGSQLAGAPDTPVPACDTDSTRDQSKSLRWLRWFHRRNLRRLRTPPPL